MGTKRIADLPAKAAACADPEHDGPKVRPTLPGLYEHKCSTCRFPSRFTVRLTPGPAAPEPLDPPRAATAEPI